MRIGTPDFIFLLKIFFKLIKVYWGERMNIFFFFLKESIKVATMEKTWCIGLSYTFFALQVSIVFIFNYMVADV